MQKQEKDLKLITKMKWSAIDMLSIDEIKRQIFIDSEEVCGNTMIDTYSAQEYVEQAYDKAIDDIKEKLIQNGFIYTQHALDVFNEIVEQMKVKEK